VLSASGHIAGVVNPPAAKKYSHWTGDKTPSNPDAWLAAATEHPGSWWPDWMAWLKTFAGKEIPATSPGRKPGSGKLKAIEDAPGRYVKLTAE
jgi:polyhydroxyalkanoate synthase